MSIELKVKKYKDILDVLPTPQEKYQYLIEQARSSNEFPEELRQDAFKVSGCASQVWLVPVEKDGDFGYLVPVFPGGHDAPFISQPEPCRLRLARAGLGGHPDGGTWL